MYRFISIILVICICFNFPVRGKEEVQNSKSVDDEINYLITKKNLKVSLKGISSANNSFVTDKLEESDALTTGESESNSIPADVSIDDSENDQTLSNLLKTIMSTLNPLEDNEITTLNPNEVVNEPNQTIISQEVLLKILEFIAHLQGNNIKVKTLLKEIEFKNVLRVNVPSLTDFQTIQNSNQLVMDGLVNLLTTITYSEDGKSFSSPQVENLREHLLQLEESSQLVTSEITYLHNVLSSLTDDVKSLKQQSVELKSMVLEASQGYKAAENIFQELSSTKQSMDLLLHEIRDLRLQG